MLKILSEEPAQNVQYSDLSAGFQKTVGKQVGEKQPRAPAHALEKLQILKRQSHARDASR